MWRKVAIMRLAKEVRAFKPSIAIDRVIEAEESAHTNARAFIGDMPEPKLIAPAMPEEGRGRIGASRQRSEPQEPARQPEPVRVAARPVDQVQKQPEPGPPPHDPVTGEVHEPRQEGLGF